VVKTAREYTFSHVFTNPGAITLLQFVPGSSMPVRVLSANVTQPGSTTSAQVDVKVLRKTAAATVTAAALNTDIRRKDPGDSGSSAQLGTALSGYLATAEGTDGEILDEQGVNMLNGYYYEPQPERTDTVPGGGIVAVKLGTAFTGTVIAQLTVQEGW
jgi:hypothetical protein